MVNRPKFLKNVLLMIKEDPVRKAVCLIAFSLFVFAFSVATAQKTGKTEISICLDG